MRADAMPGRFRSQLAQVFCTWAGATLFILVMAVAAPAAPKQVMLLHTSGFQGYEEYGRSIRDELDRQYRQPLEIDEALIGQTISANQSEAASFVDYLRVRLANRQPDLIVSVGAPAANFLQQHKQLLPHDTPMVFAAITQNLVPAGLTENDTVVMFSFHFVGLFDKILLALPETKNVIVLSGNSPNEKSYLRGMRSSLERFTDRVTFRWLAEMLFDDILKRIAELAPRSIIIAPIRYRYLDAGGVVQIPSEAFGRLYATANAPIFGLFDDHVGSGVLGAAGELPFGSLVARHGQIIAEATNEIVRFTDESRHAEIVAIARARQLMGDEELSACTLYSTVEPCPMCSFCIRSAGIGRVVFALGSPRLGGLSRWNILGDDRYPLLFGPVPELVPGILAENAHKVWIGLRPVVGRAIWWFGYLSETTTVRVGVTRARYRYSMRRFISMFLRRGKRDSNPAWAPLLASPICGSTGSIRSIFDRWQLKWHGRWPNYNGQGRKS
jgi:tRNA(Arg) A34 adenosine deaminase TadA